MSNLKTLVINGQTVADLRIVHEKRNFAIVDLEVLDRLIAQLGVAATAEIIKQIIEKLEKCYSVEQAVNIMASEVAFRRTITAMQGIDLQDLQQLNEVKSEPEKNGKLASANV